MTSIQLFLIYMRSIPSIGKVIRINKNNHSFQNEKQRLRKFLWLDMSVLLRFELLYDILFLLFFCFCFTCQYIFCWLARLICECRSNFGTMEFFSFFFRMFLAKWKRSWPCNSRFLMKLEHVHNSRIAGFDLSFTIMAFIMGALPINLFSKFIRFLSEWFFNGNATHMYIFNANKMHPHAEFFTNLYSFNSTK